MREITLYGKRGEAVFRRVLPECTLLLTGHREVDTLGAAQKDSFFLVVPGEEEILPGDRIFPGIGPELPWEDTHPGRLPGAMEITKTKKFCPGGAFCHTQAWG